MRIKGPKTAPVIAFLSLFFGLISGRHRVELTVNGPVASVEILLAGRVAGTISGPPWATEIDFGRDLLPHYVVARALDAAGHEIARAEEGVNLPKPLQKVAIVLEGERGGSPRAARVAWTNLRGVTPLSSFLTFDGLPVPLDASGRGVLPPHDLEVLHLLRAEVQFPSELVHEDVAYGGEYRGEIATELTGFPVRVRRGSWARFEELGGRFAVAGQPVAVIAVEEGPAQLFVVRSPAAREMKGKLGTKGFGAGTSRNLQVAQGTQVRIVFPYASRFSSAAGLTDIFEVFNLPEGELTPLLEDAEHRTPSGSGEHASPRLRIADAVAAAGLEAIGENRRRALLLVLSGSEADESEYDPATVRRYLAALHVPLFVWCLNEPAPGSAAAAWGVCEEVTLSRNLARGIDGIRDELDGQRIVLVEGRHLPQAISLSPAAAGVEIP